VKALLKLIVVALIANALWRTGSAYATFYKFKDSIYDAAMQEGSSEEDLKQKIVELARTYDLPLTASALTVSREAHHTAVQAAYTKPVAILPGYEYSWPFTVDINAYVIAPPTRRGDLLKP
jgi:hypothetical protein